jgi:hypothetical protein
MALGIGRGFQAADENERAQQALELREAQERRIREQQEAERHARGLNELAGLERDFKAQLSNLRTPDEYEHVVSAAEQVASSLARAHGVRYPANRLRAVYRFTAPDKRPALYAAVDKFLKNPINKPLVESGEWVKTGFYADQNGDGHPEFVALPDAVRESGYPVAIDRETQQPFIVEAEGADNKLSADAESIYQDLKGKARLAGTQLTPDVTLRLKQQAIEIVDRARRRGRPASGGGRAANRTAAQQAARNELFDAFASAVTDEQLAARFSERMSTLGLSFRKELMNARRQLRSEGAASVPPYERGTLTPDDQLQRGREAVGGTAVPAAPTSEAPSSPLPASTPVPEAHKSTPYRVGQIVMVKGKKVRVDKLLPDGKYEGTIVR